jgi:hypothetical protein
VATGKKYEFSNSFNNSPSILPYSLSVRRNINTHVSKYVNIFHSFYFIENPSSAESEPLSGNPLSPFIRENIKKQ